MSPPAAKDETASRKRKNGGGKESGSASAAASSEPKVSKAGLYKEIAKLEEAQCLARTPQEDLQLNAETIGDLKRIVKEVQEAKLSKKAGSPESISDLRAQANLHFLTLKKLNRLDKLRVRNSREATQAAKARVDALNLKLQGRTNGTEVKRRNMEGGFLLQIWRFDFTVWFAFTSNSMIPDYIRDKIIKKCS